MSDPASIRKQLKIKSGAVHRLFKETSSYGKEVQQLEQKRIRLTENGAEEWDIKNATKMIEESNKMVADTKNRLGKAVEELEPLITSTKKEKALPEDDEELQKAEKILQEATA